MKGPIYRDIPSLERIWAGFEWFLPSSVSVSLRFLLKFATRGRVKSIAVASYSFSCNSQLRDALESAFPQVPKVWNEQKQVLNEAELNSFLKGHSHAIVGRERISAELLKRLPELKTISKYGVGLDGLDLTAMSQAGLRLGWTPGVNKTAVAELALTFMLTLIRKVNIANRSLGRGEWSRPKAHQLSGKTIGIIGCGHVGRELVRLLSPFGCKILVHDIRSAEADYQSFYQHWNLQSCDLGKLLSHSDIVTIHTPRNLSTEGLIDGTKIALMKPSAVLINTARGGIIEEGALTSALSSKKISGAGLDVFEEEPSQNFELLKSDLVLATPHIGGASEEAILAMGMAAIEGLSAAVDPLSLLRYQ